MISRLTGVLAELDLATLVLDVAGVGYEVEVSSGVLQTAPVPGAELTLYTHFVVREDAQLLFGFANKAERDLFRAFIKINGVGPKLGLALISSIDLQTLSLAVRNKDISVLTKVPGIGKTTAARLMVELENRADALAEIGGPGVRVDLPAGLPADLPVADEAEGALIALGYRPQDATRAITQVLNQDKEAQLWSVEELVRHALRTFARGQQNRAVKAGG